MSTKYKYIGEQFNTRGDFGENVEVITRLAWGIPPCDCEQEECQCHPQWYESEEGHTFGVWDSTYGWIAPLSYINLSDIGQALN